jgi:hypothetical protein
MGTPFNGFIQTAFPRQWPGENFTLFLIAERSKASKDPLPAARPDAQAFRKRNP